MKINQNSRTKNTLLNLASSLGGQLLTTVLKFITRTVFISTLGKSYLGIGGLFSNILTMLSLTELGLDTAMNFRLYKPIAENDTHRLRVLMKFFKQAYRVIGIVILLIGISLVPALRFLIKDYDSLEVLKINATLIFLLYLLQSVSSYLFFAYRTSIIRAAQKTYILNLCEYVITIVTNIVQVVILLVWKNFVAYTASVIFFNILKNAVNAYVAKKLFPDVFIPEKDSLSREELISLFKDCGATFVYKMNVVVLKATDNLILSTFIGLEIVGMYSNYLMFYTTIKTFLQKLYSSVKASMGNYFATEDISKSYFMFEVMNFLTIVLYGTGCVGIAVEANEVIECWIGSSYLIPQPFPILIAIELILLGLKNNLGQIRNITGVFRQMWFRPVLGMIVNLTVSIIAVQFIGIYGVIIGTITSDITTFFVVDPVVIHKYGFNDYKPVSEYYRKNLMYLLVLVLIGIVDMIICRTLFNGFGIVSMLIHVLICGISVPGVFVIVYWNDDRCKYIRNKAITISRTVTEKMLKK